MKCPVMMYCSGGPPSLLDFFQLNIELQEICDRTECLDAKFMLSIYILLSFENKSR